MTDIDPDLDDAGPDWGGVLTLTADQRDNIAADPDVAAAWRELAPGVAVLITHLGEHEDGTLRARHRLLNWPAAETMIEACDSQPARAELKAERAKGGNWQASMRTKATARVEKKPKAQRDKAATDNRNRRNRP